MWDFFLIKTQKWVGQIKVAGKFFFKEKNSCLRCFFFFSFSFLGAKIVLEWEKSFVVMELLVDKNRSPKLLLLLLLFIYKEF